MHPDKGQDNYVAGKTRWRVGLTALRRLRGMVDEEERDARFRRFAARLVAAVFAVILLAAAAAAVFAPAALRDLFRIFS